MRVIVAGGRDYILSKQDIEKLDALFPMFSELVSGGCRGVDLQGEDWAKSNYIPISRFPADWDKHGRSAGPIRNAEMAAYADAVVLFPGGKGTLNMKSEARKKRLTIYDYS